MIKKVKCNVCNYKFFIEKEKVKEVVEDNGVSGVMTGKKIYNAIDCPNCGCQKILWPRMIKNGRDK